MSISNDLGQGFGDDGSQGVPPGCLTRQQAADRLGMPLSSFRRNVQDKLLASRVHRGQYFFLLADVEALAATEVRPVARSQDPSPPVRGTPVQANEEYSTMSAAGSPAVPLHVPATPIDASTYSKVYRHLGRGYDPAACVRDLCLEPSIVDYIHNEWRRQKTVQGISLRASQLLRKIRRKYVKDDSATMEEALERILRQLDAFEEETFLLRFQLYLLDDRLSDGWFVNNFEATKLREHQIGAQPGQQLMDGLEEEAKDYNEEVARSYVGQPKP